jgi:chromosome segregation ATPase
VLAAREAAIRAQRAAESERSRQQESHAAEIRRSAGEQRRLEALLAAARSEVADAREAKDLLEEKLRDLGERAVSAFLARDRVQAELLAANDRLEKAYKDIAEMEKQLIDVRRNAAAPIEPLRLGG